jgi:hypothetical protein
MSSPRAVGDEAGAGGVGSPVDRLVKAWRHLPSERRLAAGAALGLFVTLFLPWYQETVIASGVGSLRSVSASLTGWAAFSFVEAAVLLVAAGVLLLLFVRAEGQAFHVPGGDGGVITAAGFWTCVLIVWRMFDKEGTTGHGQYATASGIEWGIFIALGVAGLLAYAGTRIRLAHEPEPPLPGERPRRRRRGRRAPDGSGGGLGTAVAEPPAVQAPPAPSAGRSRSGELELDTAWIEPEAAREPEGTRRPEGTRQPESTREPEGTRRPEGTRQPEGTREPERKRPRSIGADAPADSPRIRRLRAGRDAPDELADPPTARFARSAPAPEPNDQLTIPLDPRN